MRRFYLKTTMNAESTPKDQPETVYFDAELRPHRSLSPTGFTIVMVAAAALGFAIGTAFMIAGAWPVMGFCGLELLLLYVAFRLNCRSGRRYEHIRLTDGGLEIHRYGPKGDVRSSEIEPNWLRVDIGVAPPHKGQLVLSSHGRAVTIGGFLGPDEKIELATALRAAIERYRTPTG